MNDDSYNQNSVIDGTHRAVLAGVELATPNGPLGRRRWARPCWGEGHI